MRRIRPNPTYSNVISTIALFLILGGTAYAVDGSLAGQNTVGSADIINGEVQSADIRDANLTTADIRAGAVTSGKIADGEVRSGDVLDDDLTGADIDESSLGPVPAAAVSGNVLAARVDSSGTLFNVRGATASSKTSTGRYIVSFNRTIGGCAPIVTPFGNAAFASWAFKAGDGTALEVLIKNSAGGGEDRTFAIAVIC